MIDFKFSNTSAKKLQKYDLPFESAPGKQACLIVAPATEDNIDYYNALLTATSKGNVRVQLKKKITAATMDDNREMDKKLYAQHVIKDWENIVDSKGEKVPFSFENVYSLLTALDDSVSKAIFTDLRIFCSSFENFLSDSDLLVTEEVAKN